ncbi:hypothetical protein HY17_08135 [Hyphomonas sp. CY54-11-8]|nr:hypothetical protein HY17_08135 [Hyphomonas sp. CY54-11-8]
MERERQFDRVDQESAFFVYPKPREDRRVSVADPPDNTRKKRLDEHAR